MIPPPRKNKKAYDFLVAGEIVEHLDNPVAFLQELNVKYGNLIDKILITVPNAFHVGNLELIINGVEQINTDHRYWFTPYTICKVAHQAGFKLRELYYTGWRQIAINGVQYDFEKSLISNAIILIADFVGCP